MSVQEKLGRVRPEIVHITYELETYGELVKHELAFVMGVMSDLSGDRVRPLPELRKREFVNIDRDNIGSIQQAIRPHLDLVVRNEMASDGTNLAIGLDFPVMESFSPVGVLSQVEPLHELLVIRQEIASVAVRSDGKQDVTDLLEEVLRRADQVLKGKQFSVSHGVDMGIKQRIADIDELLSKQLNAILHATRFQKLESAWRGLNYLVMNSETSPRLQLRLLNVSKSELFQDLTCAQEYDRSQIFRKIHEPFDIYGGIPFGAMIGDYEFDGFPDDIGLLTEMAHVAAAAHAPFLTATSPRLFGWRNFTDLNAERDLARIFDPNLNPDYIKWEQFRRSDDARYVALVLPHILLRSPYNSKQNPVEEFNFAEDVDSRAHNKFLWGNAAYALAQRINQAFVEFGWHVAFCGFEGGGRVADLPLHTFVADSGTEVIRCPMEVIVRERRAGELIKLGLIPLVMYDNTDFAVFIDAPSTQMPKQYADDYANANSALSADLRCTLAASRFMHYLRAICRDKQGSFTTAEQLQTYLQTWIIENYTVANADAKQAIKSYRPLREAKIDIREKPGKPGYYAARVWLAPHIPFKGLSASVSLVAEMKSGS